MISATTPCPCGSGRPYADCCGPLHRGERPAATAEELMRSRYTAYVLQQVDYLLASWHPSTRPPRAELEQPGPDWLSLTIHAASAGGTGDTQGEVTFTARYRGGVMSECSRFVREGGEWLYLDGAVSEAQPPGRNAPCPCGSGKKYKRCCGG